MPWLLKDFKISKEGATLSVTKEKADYFDLYHLPKHGIILKDKTIYFKPTDNDSPALYLSRYLYKNTVHGARTSSFYICYDKNILDSDDGDLVLKKIMERYLNPLRVYEYNCQLSKDKKNERGMPQRNGRLRKAVCFPCFKRGTGSFFEIGSCGSVSAGSL